jgi:hypothetical protein
VEIDLIDCIMKVGELDSGITCVFAFETAYFLILGLALLKATMRKPTPAKRVIGQKINSRYIRFGIGTMTAQFRYGIVTGILKMGTLISQVKKNIRIAGSTYRSLKVLASKEKGEDARHRPRGDELTVSFCYRQFGRLQPTGYHITLRRFPRQL